MTDCVFDKLGDIPGPIQLRMSIVPGSDPSVPAHKVACAGCGADCWESDSVEDSALYTLGTIICSDCLEFLAKKEDGL